MNDSVTDLLDEKLDDLEDLPEFKPFPPGAHQVTASFSSDEINGKAVVKLDFKLISVQELANPEDVEPKPGDTAGTIFMLDNEFGRGNLKKLAKPFQEALGLSTIREIVEQAKDVECVILTSIRVDKKDPDREYLNVKEIHIV